MMYLDRLYMWRETVAMRAAKLVSPCSNQKVLEKEETLQVHVTDLHFVQVISTL